MNVRRSCTALALLSTAACSGVSSDPTIGAPTDDAGQAAPPDAGTSTPVADAGTSPVDAALPHDAAAADSAPPAAACGTLTSIQSILAQASDSTHSTSTPMGTRFESAAAALPISAANATFLATASSNPTVEQATSATGLEWHPMTVTLYPSGMPAPEDIMQHAIGDCDGDSALASLAYVNPEFVQSLITDHGDGTYGVAMFDPAGRAIVVAVDSTILVDTSNASDLGQVSANSGGADWASVLEKAVMKYDVAYGMVGQLDGIGSEELIPMFTGNGDSVAFNPGALTPAQMQQVVEVSLAAGDLITGGFDQELPLGADQTVTLHGYAVMIPTDPTADIVDMRNPWGVNPWASASMSGYDTSTDGLVHIPMATSPTAWASIIDLRIIAPPAACVGVTTPFAPLVTTPAMPIRIRDAHARRTRL